MDSAIGHLYDHLSKNIGDQAMGTAIPRLLKARGVDRLELADATRPGDHFSRFAFLIVGGGELLHPRGHGFYDAFRVPGEHVLCACGTVAPLTARHLANYRLVSVRSQWDKANLKAAPDGVRIAPCPTVLYEDVVIDTGDPFGLPENPIGLHLHAGVLDEPIDTLLDALRDFDASRLVFLSFTPYNRDLVAQRVLAQELGARPPLELDDPDTAFAVVRRCSALVTASLHATIFAYASGVPFLSITCTPKIGAFLQDRQLSARALENLGQLTEHRGLLDQEADWQQAFDNDRQVTETLLAEISEFCDEALTRPQVAKRTRWRPPSHVADSHWQHVSTLGEFGLRMADQLATRIEMHRHREYVERLEHELEDARKSREPLDSYAIDLQAQLEDQQKRNQEVTAYSEHLSLQLRRSEAEALKAATHITRLTVDVEEKSDELAASSSYSRGLEERLTNFDQVRDYALVLEEQLTSHKLAMAEAGDHLQKLEALLATEREASLGERRHVERIEALLVDRDEEIVRLRAFHAQIVKDLSQADEYRLSLEDQLESLRATPARLMENNPAAARELAHKIETDLRHEFETTLENASQQNVNLQDQLQRVEAERQRASLHIVNLDEQLGNQLSALEALQQAKDDTEERLSEHRSALATAEEYAATLEKQLAEGRFALTNASEYTSQLEETLAQRSTGEQEVAEHLQDLESSIADKQRYIEELEKANAQARNETQEHAAAELEAREANDRHRQELAAYCRKLEEHLKALEAQQTESAVYQKNLEDQLQRAHAVVAPPDHPEPDSAKHDPES